MRLKTIATRSGCCRFIGALLAVCCVGLFVQAAEDASQSVSPVARYELHRVHDPDGTGKFYMGREIAQVMGHQGADWLERPERAKTEAPDEVIKQMRLKPTDFVADIGAGTGYFSFRLSGAVSQGKVYAVDIQTEMLAIIEQRKR